MQYLDRNTGDVHDNDCKFDPDQGAVNAVFEKLTGWATNVYDQSRGLKITLSYSFPYSTMVLSTAQNQAFYCLEPSTAHHNSLNTGDRLLYLEPETSCQMLVRLTVTFFNPGIFWSISVD